MAVKSLREEKTDVTTAADDVYARWVVTFRLSSILYN